MMDEREDIDPQETAEWLESMQSVLQVHGPERAHFLLDRVIDHARRAGAYLPYSPNTAYLNTIPVGQEAPYPGDLALEKRLLSYIRWNAMAMVVHANRKSAEYGGHIATYASSAVLYEVGFNHFWRAPSEKNPGDMIFIQGHSSPGIYARAFLEGRLSEEQVRAFQLDPGRAAVLSSRAVPGSGSSRPCRWARPDDGDLRRASSATSSTAGS
jgi:pyruvate dehydrogenase E1 component